MALALPARAPRACVTLYTRPSDSLAIAYDDTGRLCLTRSGDGSIALSAEETRAVFELLKLGAAHLEATQ